MRLLLLPLLTLALSMTGSPAYCSNVIDSSADEDVASAMKIASECFAKDVQDSSKRRTLGNYNFLPVKLKNTIIAPTMDDMPCRSFRLSLGNSVLISPKRDDFHETFWIVNPVSGIKLNTNLNREPLANLKLNRLPSPIIDIDGDGQLEVIVGSRDSCAHGTWHYWIYKLDKKAKLYDQFADTDLWPSIFTDLGGTGKIDAIRFDTTFQSWYDSEAGYYAPVVVLSPSKGGYRFNKEIMRRAALKADELRTLADSLRKEFEPIEKDNSELTESGAQYSTQPRFWRNLLDLIYTGNANQAWSLVEQVWPEKGKVLLSISPSGSAEKLEAKTKTQFINEFLEKLSTSPYFADLCQLNKADKHLNNFRHQRKQ